MVSATIEQDPSVTTIYPAGNLTAQEAREITDRLNENVGKLRHDLLRFYRGKGWESLGYDSYKTWAEAEFKYGFQHAYTLKRVAEVEDNLGMVIGGTVTVPINVGKQLAKLPTPELQLEALQTAQTNAETIDSPEVTEKDAKKAVEIVLKREFVRKSPHKVVAQVVNDNGLSVEEGKRVIKWLDRSPPETQLYVQEKIAAGLKDVRVIHNIVNRHREFVRNGKPSRNLTEIDSTGKIGGVALDKAREVDWNRMAAENQAAILSELAEEKAEKQKELDELAKEQGIEIEPIVEPKAMNAYTNSPERTLQALKRVLDDKTLKGLAELIMQEQGYVQSTIDLAITDDYIDLDSMGIPLNEMEGKTLELWTRVKS